MVPLGVTATVGGGNARLGNEEAARSLVRAVAGGFLALVLAGCGEHPATRQGQTAASTHAEPSPTPAPVTGTPVKAEPEAAHLATIVAMSGTCLRLVAAEEAAPECQGAMLNFVYTNGRSSFLFFDKAEGRLISFSGLSGDDVFYGDAITQPLDSITLTRKADPRAPESLRAIGACRYTDPFSGPGTVTCMAETESGRWVGEFRSNGEPPTVSELDEP